LVSTQQAKYYCKECDAHLREPSAYNNPRRKRDAGAALRDTTIKASRK
jgi:hypothetical protein